MLKLLKYIISFSLYNNFIQNVSNLPKVIQLVNGLEPEFKSSSARHQEPLTFTNELKFNTSNYILLVIRCGKTNKKG